MNEKGINQIRCGALIAYLLIVINAAFTILVTPFILKNIGSSSYGVYKTMGSLSSSLLILDLGIGGTLMRYIANYRANGQDKKIDPFVSMALCEIGIIIPIILLVEIILYYQLDHMYSTSFTVEELLLAKQIFIILSITILINIFENFLNGIITGYNNFVFGNGIKLVKLVFRIVLIVILLPLTKSAILLVSLSLLLSLVGIVVQLIFILSKYRIRLSFNSKNWEKGVFRESFSYTSLIFLTTLAAQVNNNLDNVIVGAFCGASQVTVYSFGLVIFGMFEQLSTAISGVALPTVSQIVAKDNWKENVQNFVVKLGRIQFMLLGAVATGFAVLGKDFLGLWLGKGYDDVYWIALILMIPALFELCVNVCLSVLRAKNMLGFRTGVLVISTVINLVISVAGIHKWGYFSAAVGTAASFILGSLIVMNIYYYKKLQFNMLSIYYRIINRTLPCIVISGVIIIFTSRIINGSWLALFANIAIFLVVYGLLMLLWGCSAEERESVLISVKKIVIKRKE